MLQAGYRAATDVGAFLDGPQFASTYVAPGDPSQHRLTYGRFDNPTWTGFEEALGQLEGGYATSFASGMAAVAAVFGVCLKPGDFVVLPSDSYYTTRVLASNWLAPIGIEVRTAPTRDNAQRDVLGGARLLWLETPSNPGLDICDIGELVAAAREHGTLVAVDNTTATGYLQQPLALGADYVVASDTKALSGHSDVLLGHVAVRDTERVTGLRAWRTQHGSIPGPMEAWLAHRSLATLPLRLTRQCASAQTLAEFLVTQSVVTAVYYPGLAAHPGHEVAKRQMHAFGGVVSFELSTASSADRFLRALTLVREATSFGGVHSTAERRARWGGDAIGEGFIRFSVGCEAIEDILADVSNALRAAVERVITT
ncbi:MAG: cystathionine gamma-lyase [Gammaproteobacteria bacterium]